MRPESEKLRSSTRTSAPRGAHSPPADVVGSGNGRGRGSAADARLRSSTETKAPAGAAAATATSARWAQSVATRSGPVPSDRIVTGSASCGVSDSVALCQPGGTSTEKPWTESR